MLNGGDLGQRHLLGRLDFDVFPICRNFMVYRIASAFADSFTLPDLWYI